MANMEGVAFDDFCNILQDTLHLFDELIAFEGKKLTAVAANDVQLVDRYMNEEQAYLMRMRGLDIKREQLQEKLGVSNLPLKEIANTCQGEQQQALLSIRDALTTKADELKAAIGTTRQSIQLQLSSISILLERLESGTTTYNQDGTKTTQSPPERFTPTKA